jgi:hypothetical protein
MRITLGDAPAGSFVRMIICPDHAIVLDWKCCDRPEELIASAIDHAFEERGARWVEGSDHCTVGPRHHKASDVTLLTTGLTW